MNFYEKCLKGFLVYKKRLKENKYGFCVIFPYIFQIIPY